MAVEIKLTNDKRDEVTKQLELGVKQALMAIGAKAEGYAKKDCPVDTGRLRNSITWAVEGAQGTANAETGEKAKWSDYKKHWEPEKNVVVIGTNVTYAPQQEFYDMSHKTGKAHFLRDAMTNHSDEYKKTAEAALKA